jgi:two-component system NtrC family sensor kinase
MSSKVMPHSLKNLICAVFWIVAANSIGLAQEHSVLITNDMVNNEVIMLGALEGWKYNPRNVSNGADPDLDVSDWQNLRPTDIDKSLLNTNGAIDGWFRIRIRLDSTFADTPLFWRIGTWGAIDLYVDGDIVKQYGVTSPEKQTFEGYNPLNKLAKYANLEVGRDYVISFYITDHLTSILNRATFHEPFRHDPLIRLSTEEYNEIIVVGVSTGSFWGGAVGFAASMIALIFWILYLQNREEHILKSMTATTTVIGLGIWFNASQLLHSVDLIFNVAFTLLWQYSVLLYTGLIIYSLYIVITEKSPFKMWHIMATVAIVILASFVTGTILLPIIYFISALVLLMYLFLLNRSAIKEAKRYLFWGAVSTFLIAVLVLTLEFLQVIYSANINSMLLASYYLSMPLSMFMYINRRLRDSLEEVRSQSEQVVKLSREKQDILAAQNEILETQVAERTSALHESLEELKKAQEQLIQSEKMASLGQLTAGIAHEIKNPLNFVTNFSDLTRELVMEAREEMAGLGLTPDQVDRFEPILGDIEMNVSKIFEHGRRADNIVKGMLQHSRGKSGERQATDINELVGEYLNLAYHGLRAQDPSFNVAIKTDFDPNVGLVGIVPQDFSRAILNLVNNACFAADQKKRDTDVQGFKPTVTVSSKKLENEVEIIVHDNGTGIPDHVKNKIFEPFFTTKPTGVGTGLGLSMTYEIIVNQHKGSLNVNSKAGDFTEFRIIIPLTL